jgi:hypothetical protein
VRDQLAHDRVAVGADVRRVHGVAVVVERIGVLDLEHEEARKAGAGPGLVELVRLLLLDPVVAVQAEALAVVWLQVGIRRHLAEALERVREVAVVHDQRIARLRMLVEAVRQQHDGAELHRPAPELREQLGEPAACDCGTPDLRTRVAEDTPHCPDHGP